MNICEYCNIEFPPAKGHPNQKYCCRDHKNKASSIKKKEKDGKKCKKCDSSIPYGRGKRTCSDKCEQEWDEIMAAKKKNYNKKYHQENSELKPSKTILCDICHTKFETLTNRKYCKNPICVAEGKKRKATIRAREVRKIKSIEAMTAFEIAEKEEIKLAEIEEENMVIDLRFLKRGEAKINSGVYNL